MCTHTFTVQRSAQAFINYAAWPRLRQLTVARWRPSRLTPATADERCADANIFASARNTICVRGRTQRISIQSYHRRHRQLRDITTYKCPQLKARKHSHPPQMLSISVQFAEASVCNCRRTHVCVSVNVSVCIHVHGNVLVHTSLLRCLCIQSFPNYSPWRVTRGKGRAAGCHTGA